MIDIVLIAIVVAVAWFVAGEGAYAAGATLISVIIGGLLAMNYFEPLANFLQNSISPAWASRWDMIALIGLFVFFVALLRLLADKLMPTYVQVHPLLHQVVSWGGGALTGYVTMAFLLTALHTAPLPRDYWNLFHPERELRSGPLSQFGPDYQWLGFTQRVTEKPFAQSLVLKTMDDEIQTTRVFDGRIGWFWHIPAVDGEYDVMPSFPIRYATRRERDSGGGAISGSAGGAPPVQSRPRREGGRSGRGGF